MRSSLSRLAAALTISALSLPVLADQAPKNIIFLIGDGMGPAYTSAYRYFADSGNKPGAASTVFDELLTGMASTYPDDDTWVTDSAASATALATGVKTYNGAVGIDAGHNELPSLISKARELGYTTGLIATSQINHATPASFVAHDESRRNYDAIADDFLGADGQSPVADLLLGGGTKYFVRPDRNLVSEFRAQGYQYLTRLDKLDELTLPSIGLFAPKGLTPALGSEYPKRLTMMTQAALSQLPNQDKPFVLMIEASQIDWCGHANDIACAMAEMDDFAAALEQVKAYVDARGDTLMVATADHSTGGLTLGKHGVYQWQGHKLKSVKQMPDEIAMELQDAPEELASIMLELTGIALSDVQIQAFERALKDREDDNTEMVANLVKQVIDEATFTGWTTSGHDAVDVQIFAHGPGADNFGGFMDNTEIGKRLLSLLQKP